PVVATAVQKHGALHPGAQRRSGKADKRAITYCGHPMVGIVNAFELCEHALAVICSRLGRWDSLNLYGFVRGVIDGKRVESPKACGRVNPDAQLISSHPAHIEDNYSVLSDERPASQHHSPDLPPRRFFHIKLQGIELFADVPGEQRIGFAPATVDPGIPLLQIASAQL